MDLLSRIKMEEHKLIHGKGKTVYDCADHVNRSYSYLCRIASPTEDQPFPIEVAVPLMKFKKDFSLLQTIAWECGFVLVKLPKTIMPKIEESEMIQDYQSTLNQTVTSLINCVKNPSARDCEHCVHRLKETVEKSLSIKKYVEKKCSKQEELF